MTAQREVEGPDWLLWHGCAAL